MDAGFPGMKVSFGLPTHLVDADDDLLSIDGVGTLAAAAEAAGFDAVYVTEHPFPKPEWVASGGHHALDPMVVLAVVAAATTQLRLHTNLFVAAYRNPFLAAKAVASLDVLSGGRVTLGIGAGYLADEFAALGVEFSDRNERTDDAIVAMKAAWTGEPVHRGSAGYRADGNVMLPRPAQRPHPPIWIGGNSKRAIRRAVELADGWSPFPTPPGVARAARTASLSTPAELSDRLAFAADHAHAVGRTAPLDVAFIPAGLAMGRSRPLDPAAVVDSCHELAAIGVTWVTVAFPGRTRADQLDQLESFADAVLPHIR